MLNSLSVRGTCGYLISHIHLKEAVKSTPFQTQDRYTNITCQNALNFSCFNLKKRSSKKIKFFFVYQYTDFEMSLLPFVQKSSRCSDLESTKTFKTNNLIHRKEGTILDSMYRVSESQFSRDELARHKRTLTMIPVETAFSSQSDTKFEAFESKNGIFAVPRFYGIQNWGEPCEDKTSLGETLPDYVFGGKLNDVQQTACDATISSLQKNGNGGMLVLPCGYGKTVCSLYIANILKRKTLILVHKAFLVEQWQERATQFVPGCSIGKIQQNVVDADADFVICMLQSLCKRDYDTNIMKSFGTVIIDESHHMAAPVLHKALRKVHCKYILSLSATPDRKDGLTPLLFWSMGPICYKIERKPEDTMVSCMLYDGGKRKEIKQNGIICIPLMLNALVNDWHRNSIIAERVFKMFHDGRSIIVLTDRIKQLQILYKMLSEKNIQHQDMGFYIGTTSSNERAISSTKRIIMSTYSMAKEGLDIPRLDALVLATPKGDIVQAAGRIQRKCPSKKIPLIIDIIDTFSLFEQLRWKRWSFYRKESFSCQTFNAEEKEVTWYT
jgi:superfamily II DNA or RNA helicase